MPALRFALLPLLAVAAVLAALAFHRDPAPIAERRTARYEGVLLERLPRDDGTIDVSAALDEGLTVSAVVRSAPPPGSRAVLRGRLEPFDDARNPGEPSERAIEAERGIDARLDAAQVLSSRPGSGWDARTWLPRAHEWARGQLQARLGNPAAEIVAGELWGERAALPPDLRAEFQETGTVHVLVTAGLHLGAVAALVALLLARLSVPRVASCALAAGCVWGFVVWSGGALPAVRAATMLTAALAARACGRSAFSWNGLTLAAIAIAVTRPESVATASFALSFSCVGAIFACARPVEAWIERNVSLPDRVREALVLSVATQLGTWPLSAAVFLQITPYAIAANLAVVPCVALTMALGAAQLAFAWCAPAAQSIANLNSWPLAWMLGAVRTFASLPYASIPATPAPAWCVAAYDTALLGAPWLWGRGARTLAASSVALSAAFVLWPPRAADPVLRVTVLDVGQADSIVVRTPSGHAILVDAGGRLERGGSGEDSAAERVGERIVVPFLLRSGIHELDALIISHPHGDHVGGCAPVLRKIRVAEIADSGQSYGGHAYRDCLVTAREQGVPIVYPRAGRSWQTGDGIALHFIGPSLPLIAGSRNDINENSVAFILRYERFCMLFTGDAGGAAEQRFLSEDVDLRCAVLKVGHHGSAYSSTPAFIEATAPRYAIISVGRHNLFGHPARSTLETLDRDGSSTYRTDRDGATVIETNGTSMSLVTVGNARHAEEGTL